jgi:thiamine biosynthesis lipoprotein
MPAVRRLPLMEKKGKFLFASLLLLLGIALIAAILYGRREREYRSDRFLMDTLVSIRVHGSDEEKLKGAVTGAYAEMQRIADLTDRFPTLGSAAYRASDVCRINENAGIGPVRVDRDVIEMLVLAKKYHLLSEGAFDVTIGPVMDLWGFAGERPKVPPPGKLAEALSLVDSNKLIVDEQKQTAFLEKRGMKLDLGAVAKGYATEKAIGVLKSRGVTSALIDAGGNIRVIGKNSRNAPWKIGIKDPRKSGGIIAIVSLTDGSAVTSGDYYRYFESGGRRYNHILDPRTGYPATGSMSVTVMTENAGVADCLSTIFFVLEPEKSQELAGKMGGVDIFLVTADRRILHTPSLKGVIEVKSGENYRHDQGR